MAMDTERRIIYSVYKALLGEGYTDVTNVIDRSCMWHEPNALHKVRYWLSYGLKHDGNYSGTYIGRHIDTVNAYDLKYAFKKLEDALGSFGYSLNKKTG